MVNLLTNWTLFKKSEIGILKCNMLVYKYDVNVRLGKYKKI